MKEFAKYPLTYTLIVLNIVAYLISAYASMAVVDMNLEVLVGLGALYGPYTVQDAQWWRLGTAMFLHAGMTHLLMNMFSLYLVGRGAEQYFSKFSYLSIYLFSGVLGGLVSLYMHPFSVGIGASGAIFGMFGALAGFFLAHRHQIEDASRAFMKDFAVIIGLNLVIGFAIDSVDVSAHAGGLVIGFIGGFLISLGRKNIGIYIGMMLLMIVAMMQYLPTQYAQRLF